MTPISAVIIALNEARNIEKCILALQVVADEIIVMDTGSTDETIAICEKNNVIVHTSEWLGYAETKNKLNQLASHSYILSIDADEFIDSELAASILSEKEKGLSGAYTLNRMTNYMGKWIKHSGWYPDVKTRLFPKDSCHWTGAFVHEELEIPTHLEIKPLGGHLQHYSYYSFEDHRARADKYSTLTAKKQFAAGKKASFIKPLISAVGRFIGMYFIKLGVLDGYMGFKIAQISAASNYFKYQELRRLHREKNRS